MTDQIVTIAHIEAMAEEAFDRDEPRTAHNMNWHAPALATWLAAYDRRAAAKQASHQSHTAPTGRARIDLRQGC